MNRMLKWISGLLTVVMLVNMFPTVIADELRKIGSSGVETSSPYYEETLKEAEIIGEDKEKRDEYTKYFVTDQGTIIAAQYPVPVHYRDEDGKYQEIDNSLSDSSESGMVENKNAQYKIKLSKKSNGSKLVSIKGQGSEISWNLSGQGKTDIEILSVETEPSDDKTIVKNAVSSAVYRNIFPAVDIEYHINGKQIKENIILKDKSAQNEFVYEFKAQGYRVELQDKTVVFTEEKTGEVFTFSAPAVYDRNGTTTDDYSLSISNHKNNKFTLTLSVSRQWLDEEGRAYPVTVDPLTYTPIVYGWGHLETSLYEYNAYSNQYYDDEHIRAGIYSGGIFRGLIKLDNVPILKSTDRIVRATLRLHVFPQQENYSNVSDSLKVGIYQMSAPWDNSSTWNEVWGSVVNNGISGDCLDYHVINDANKDYYFDITKAAREWYGDDNWNNNGLVLKLLDETRTSANNHVFFTSSDYGEKIHNDIAPFAVIEYRNTNGLEGYYTYQNASLGQSGTAYINNYTGQLSFSHNLLSYSNNLGGVSLDGVFNSSLLSNTDKFGKGISLNIFASVKETDLAWYKYCLTDGDGTEHYFYEHEGAWVDEDGLGMTYDPTAKTITFKDKTVYTFCSDGSLKRITTANGHYTEISDDKTTVSINGTVVMTLEYLNGRLKKIKDRFGRTQETYFYNSEGYLVRIEYATAEHTLFSYDSETRYEITYVENEYGLEERVVTPYTVKRLKSVYDTASDQTIEIEYEYIEGSYRATELYLKADSETDYFGITDIDYGYNETKITFKDGSYAVCQFDSFGRTSCCYDSFGNVSAGKYNSESGITKNKLAQSVGFFNPLYSYIVDGVFARGLYTYGQSSENGIESVLADSTVAYRAVKITAQNETKYVFANPTAHQAGTTYTVSAYVKTENVDGDGVGIAVVTSNGNTYYSDKVTGTTDVNADGDYRRVTVKVELSEGETVAQIRAGIFSGSGIAYITGLTMVKGPYASDFNLLPNASFEYTPELAEQRYETLEGAYIAVREQNHSGIGSIKIGPSVATQSVAKAFVSRDVNIVGHQGDVISFGGWAKASALPVRETNSDADPERSFYIKVNFQKADGTWESAEGGTAYFNQQVNTWQFTASTVKAPADYVNITFEIHYSNQVNPGYFDDIFLIKSHENTYTYDENGNLVSSVDAAEQSSQFEFNENSNLTQMIDPTGLNYEYTYDDKGNITCATSSSGQKIQITYDVNSNPTQTLTSDEAGENKIITSAGYSQDGERTTSNTDSRGNTETYTYEDNNAAEGKYLRLSSTTLDGITTSYSYDNVTDRLTKVEQGSASVQYGYNLDGSLHFILQGGYAYTFTYDGFGRTVGVGVAERNLVNNQYDSLGRLSLVTYGNGHTAEYTYDSKDQVTSIYTTGDKSQTVNYSYDAKGQIIDKTVSNDKETVSYAYLYDILGRITSTYSSNGHSLAVEYDGKNRVVTLSNTVGGTGFKTTYTYNDQKGIIEKSSSSKGSEIFEKSYTLDSLGRIEEYLYNTSNGYKVEFTYHNGSIEGTTTTLVKTMKVGANTFEYSYDNRGNITRITKNGSEIQSYVYDSLNQLTRENNAETNETVVFSYDNHGNILNKKIYAHTLDADLSGKTCQTIYYGYDNVWTDLLIRYKGQTITYDRIGNPLKYRDGFSFSWSAGRKLTTVSLNNGSVYMTGEYSYDDEGIRNYKEINGNITRYYLNGSTILSEITNYGGTTRRVDYIYDEAGSIYGFYVDGKSYYYQKNLQGDVTGILDADGNLLVEYIYDAYGVPTTRFTGITDSLSDAEKHEIYVLGSNNPFRYRGYYYDTETGFYYLNSRYYDPQTGRFLNADGYASTGQGVLGQNMFAYCGNDPIDRFDYNGEFFLTGTIFGIAAWKVFTAVGLYAFFVVVNISIVQNPPTLPSISLPTIEAKPKIEEKVEEKTEDIAPSLPKKPPRDPVHHIVAKKAPRAEEARQILKGVEINPRNDPLNLVQLPQSFHVSLHNNAYYDYVNYRLRPFKDDRAGVEMTLQLLRMELIVRSMFGVRWD